MVTRHVKKIENPDPAPSVELIADDFRLKLLGYADGGFLTCFKVIAS